MPMYMKHDSYWFIEKCDHHILKKFALVEALRNQLIFSQTVVGKESNLVLIYILLYKAIMLITFVLQSLVSWNFYYLFIFMWQVS